jgi:hypothetical protein
VERRQVFVFGFPVMLDLEGLDEFDLLPLVQRIGNDTQCILLILYKDRVDVL